MCVGKCFVGSVLCVLSHLAHTKMYMRQIKTSKMTCKTFKDPRYCEIEMHETLNTQQIKYRLKCIQIQSKEEKKNSFRINKQTTNGKKQLREIFDAYRITNEPSSSMPHIRNRFDLQSKSVMYIRYTADIYL